MKQTGKLDIDGDDSSDEESSKELEDKPLKKFSPKAEQFYFKEQDPKQYSFIVHAVGVKYFYSSSVSKLYYQKKANKDFYTQANMIEAPGKDTAINDWLLRSLKESIENVFRVEKQLKASESLAKSFLKKNSDYIESIVTDYHKNIRVILREITKPKHPNAVEFNQSCSLIASQFNAFLSDQQKHFDSELDLAPPPCFQKSHIHACLGDFTKEFLIKIKYFNKSRGRFNKASDREEPDTDDFAEEYILKIVDQEKPHGNTVFGSVFNTEDLEIFFTVICKNHKKYLVQKKPGEVERGHFPFHFKAGVKKTDLAQTCFSKIFDNRLLEHYLPYNSEALIKEISVQVTKAWQDTFLTVLKKVKLEMKIRLVRALPLQQYELISDNFDSFLANIRLVMRIQKRRIDQLEEDRQIQSESFEGETYNVAWRFHKTTIMAIETQEISFSKDKQRYARSDIVPNLGNYQNICDSLYKHFTDESTRDVTVAQYILALLKGDEIPDLDKKLNAKKFIINLTYLLFGLEVQRNPGSLVTHLMMLDLIISEKVEKDKPKKFSWKYFLSHDGKKDKYGGGYMPMSMGKYLKTNEGKLEDTEKSVKTTSHAVQCARTLAKHYGIFSIKRWNYEGEEASEKSMKIEEIRELLNRENHIVKKWLQIKTMTNSSNEQILEERIREVFKLVQK